jgi:hypothetical protein
MCSEWHERGEKMTRGDETWKEGESGMREEQKKSIKHSE